jgi:capsular polysaccharide biosynthesis protein
VAERLRLDSVWAARYGGRQKLNPSEVLQLLKSRVDIRPLSSTSLIEIKAFSEQPQEAADIANALARASRPQAEIIDEAAPAKVPARPNKPLNITLGVLVGVALGSLAGLLGAFLNRGFQTPSGTKFALR